MKSVYTWHSRVLRSLNLCLTGLGQLSWSLHQPAPSLVDRLATGDWTGEVVEAEGDLEGVILSGVVFSVEIVLSAELDRDGLGGRGHG